MKTIGGSLPRRFKATASGAITAGKPVIVEADGDVAQVAETSIAAATGTQANAANVNSEDTAVVFDSATDKFTLFYADRANSDYGTYVVGTISGTSITFGTPAVFNSAAVTNVDSVYDEASGNIVVVWAQAGTGGRSIVGSRSGDTITFGSAVTFDSNSTYGMGASYIEDAAKVFISYQRNVAGTGHGIVGTVSGTSISFGSVANMGGSVNPRRPLNAYVGSSKAVVATRDGNASPTAGKAVVATISGTSVSFGSFVTFETDGFVATGYQTDVAYDSANDKVVIAWPDGGNNDYGTAIVGTVSGTSITFGTPVVFASTNIRYYYSPTIRYSVKSGKIFTVYVDASNSDQGKYIRGTVSGTSISFADGATFTTDQINWLSLAVNDTNNKFAVGYKDDTAGGDPSAQIIQDAYLQTNLTAENYIGIAEYAAADTETATVFVKGGVSTPGGTALDPPTAGTAVEFEDGGTGTYQAIVYDPDSNKVVIAYTDAGDSNKGKAVVGTVSGTSISFGTPVEFEAGGTSYIVATYDTNSDKVVIAYQDAGNSLYGTAIVGTVSGTSISFGTAVVYNAGEVTYQGIAFDSSNNKVVICYRDNANANYATAIVGTVSGTSISFGTEVVYNSANSLYNVATFDSTNSKVVIAYRDGGNSNYGTAIVGTVSGTSISFGSEAVFSGTSSTQWMGATFDSTNGKVVLAYRNDGSTQTDAVVGTVSGTSISFGTPVLVLDGSNTYHALSFDSVRGEVGLAFREATTNDLEFFVGTVSGTSISFGTALEVAGNVEYSPVAYDSSAQKFVVSYHDNDDSSKGKAAVVSTTFSMTPGQTYFVQGDGTLGLTADSPSVTAGTAVTSLKLIVKG